MQYALQSLGADIYVVESQGEQTLGRLVACLEEGRSIAAIPNLAYFESGQLVITPAEPEQNSMDDGIIEWTQWPRSDLGATIQTRTARSCAFSCAFCNYPTRAGRLALATVETVGRELDSISCLGTVKNVVFIDDTFNVPLPRFKELCRLMIARRYGFEWFSYLRCSNIDAEAVDLMAKSGCRGVFLGIESGSPTILKNMNKSATPEKYAVGIEMLRNHGILTFGSFIAGFPGETDETFRETREFIEQHRPDYYRIQLWYCEVGTPIERDRARYNIVGQGFNWRHATMTSQEAMNQIEQTFLHVRNSIWLPQWSFDFWIIPYLLGKGLTSRQFRDFMIGANELLALELREGQPATMSPAGPIARLTSQAVTWDIVRPEQL